MSRTLFYNSIRSDILLFLLFSLLNLFGIYLNHIDDTDETHGYWEPLHYLLYGKGLQTWEYSPGYNIYYNIDYNNNIDYSIRTYSFIVPVYFYAYLLREYCIVNKIILFQSIRFLFSLITAFSECKFLYSIKNRFGNYHFIFNVVFILFSPGIFFCSTSYLPSALCMNLIMLCFSAMIDGSFYLSITYGSIAVLWSGWPFVALLLIPIGINMIISTIFRDYKANQFHTTAFSLLSLVFFGIFIVSIVLVPSILIDFFMYRKWTSPTLNILLYNAIGGSGDELYGIEPISYYLKNLTINMSLSWIVVLLSPVIIFLKLLTLGRKSFLNGSNDSISSMSTIIASTMLWLCVLFLRPHKEERFMYPIYPLLSVIASSLCSNISDAFYYCVKSGLRLEDDKKEIKMKISFVSILVVSLISIILFTSRLTSNYRNYGGYFQLWKDAYDQINNDSSNNITMKNICIGNEWYSFPSHFFLPSNSQLVYINDGFKGILPQHYAPVNGTWIQPLQPFNDKNKEEISRYVKFDYCDYLVISVDTMKDYNDNSYEQQRSIISQFIEQESYSRSKIIHIENNEFCIVSERDVISTEFSLSSVARAYYIPFGFSDKRVKFKKYILLNNLKKIES